jgi:hypothetical protein
MNTFLLVVCFACVVLSQNTESCKGGFSLILHKPFLVCKKFFQAVRSEYPTPLPKAIANICERVGSLIPNNDALCGNQELITRTFLTHIHESPSVVCQGVLFSIRVCFLIPDANDLN